MLEARGKVFILAKRKGWTTYRWEQVLRLPHFRDLCPRTLLCLYASITESIVPVGTKEAQPLFWSLTRPYKPIGAKRLAVLTKNVLAAHGIDTAVWQAHATRGAAVDQYHSWGLPP